ncbi:hypothetical protein EZ428_08200 [Pedobacter frigiditerrae]|uniref:Uncharacterized protein n=1 Tax=Pedobacter frigiditerrae TaxID=2530452 RepID=A0A4R0MWZ3_9SPHI|nr:hypothetical protein [Pedobacter frigiditerrae]TCC91730.1 hypothetical protein EZ428_08200 [Pedobacter frigiditerrae]
MLLRYAISFGNPDQRFVSAYWHFADEEKKKGLISLMMIPIKKENKKARTIVLLVILAALILGVGMLVNNGTVILKW